MRRLINSRAPEPDEAAIEGFDRVQLEGDAIGPEADEIAWLRPFGAAIPAPLLSTPTSAAEPEASRAPARALALAALGRRLDAVLLLRRYLDDEPQDAAARGVLAELLEQGGDADAALAELDRAIAEAASPIEILVRRGAMLARAGRMADAERDLREAIRQKPGFGPAHFQLGLTLLRRGRGGEAGDALSEALRCSPEDPEALYYLGEALQAQGKLSAALAALERASALAPADPRSYKLMGRLLDRLGRSDEAMAMHQRAREVTIR